MAPAPLAREEYLAHDGLGLADLVRRRLVTPAELVETALARLERLNPLVNAVIHRMDDAARAAARSAPAGAPFHGVPFLVKDLVGTVAGEPFRCGSRFLEGFRAPHDSELVRRYRAAGFLLLGKTNTPEFGLTPFTEPRAFGPTRNPWDLARTSGGSSGGSAAAVAAGIVPIAGGGDGGGSIRIPAACCGLFGMKPTRGRVPMGPDYGEIWNGSVVEHVLTRSVRDSAAVLDLTQGPDAGAPYLAPPPERPFLEEVTRPPGRLRIAFTDRPWLGGQVHDDCRLALQNTARLLESLGHEVEEATPAFDGQAFSQAFLLMVAAELAGDIADAGAMLGRRPSPRWFEPSTWALALVGRATGAGKVASAIRRLDRIAREIGPFFERYAVLLTPTLAQPPIPVGALQPTPIEEALLRGLGRLRAGAALRRGGLLGRIAERIFGFTPWTPVANVTGQPAMSVPLEWNAAGLPIGLHFMGRFGDEATLYRLAGQLERAKPWFGRLAELARGK